MPHGTINLGHHTSSTKIIIDAVIKLYDRIINEKLLIRRLNITANNIVNENGIKKEFKYEQIDLFQNQEKKEQELKKEKKEKNIQKAMIGIKRRYGNNAIIKGMNLEEGVTTIQRNTQVGGHRG